MNRVVEYIISHTHEGMSVGSFLKQQGISHPIIVDLKKKPERILVNGKWVFVNEVLNAGDKLTIIIEDEAPSKNIPPSYISQKEFEDMMVYEDEDILVINKPARLPVHPSMGHHLETLANYCAYYYANYSEEKGAFVFRCVNRLDKDTSGLVLIGKNKLSSAILSNMQSKREIHRTYLAICEGITPDKGTIDLPIARKADLVIERCVDMKNGENAVTHFWTVDTKDNYSLVKIKLETGRTHQIRVHMKAINHPLPGDFLYNPNCEKIGRQALHSYALEFNHPITKAPMIFYQELPEDFRFANWHVPENI